MMKKLTVLALCAPLSLLVACGADNDTKGEDIPATCNNNSLDVGEECDGANLNSTTCAALAGFTGGTLSCHNCKFVTTGCTAGMSYAGTYELRSSYDFSSFLPAFVGELNTALKSPGNYLLEALSEQVSSYIGGLLSPSSVKGILNIFFGSYFAALNTTEVQKMSAAVNAAVDFTKNVTVVSTLTLTAPTTVGGDVQVKEDWKELLYKWSYDCTAGDTACGEHRLAITGLTDTQSYKGAGVDLNSSSPKIKLATSAEKRVFSAPYNEIVKSYYEKIIIPKVTDSSTTTTLPGLMAWLIDCGTLATDIAKSDDASDSDSGNYSGLAVFDLSTQVLNTLCVAACGVMGDRLAAQLNAAVDKGTVEVSGFGEGLLVDANNDKKADAIKSGVWTNSITLSTDVVTPNGTFTATRVP